MTLGVKLIDDLNSQQRKNRSFDSSPEIIRLRQHLKHEKCIPVRDLRLRDFRFTGRGLCSKLKVYQDETLIEVPFHLMISLSTVVQSEIYQFFRVEAKQNLTIHDYLATFLAVERHMSDESEWKWYIDTLPKDIPNVPWLCNEKDLDILPEYIKTPIYKQWHAFKGSWNRITASLDKNWTCTCCRKSLDEDSYRWAYVMVNTRSVHVDPKSVLLITKKLGIQFSIHDQPNMAMCPYLDMFNHSDLALTSANLDLVGTNLVFKLVTHKSYDAHEQIFISYGQRDNLTLLCDYGFFTNSIFNEILPVTLEEIVCAGKFLVTTAQRDFIKKHSLCDGLKIFIEGLSFNLKGLLFVLLNKNSVYDWSTVIFTENYDEQSFVQMHNLACDILVTKTEVLKAELKNVETLYVGHCQRFEQILNYMRCRITYVNIFKDVCRKKIYNKT